jgi:uncharacterized protein (DUF2236 family)
MHPASSLIRLPWSLQRRLDAAAGAFLNPRQGPRIDFALPPGEAALVEPHSVSWRIFKNPIALYVGGLAAVILELAEPAVRTGVWEHSSFRTDPVGRLQRTALAAMVTVYGARSTARSMISGVVRMHAKVAGNTPAGMPYSAGDPRLLAWVHATAAFGIAEAYHRYVEPLTRAEVDTFYREGAPVAELYGALDSPVSDAERQALFDSMRGRLEPSPIVFQFLEIMRGAPAFPRPLLWLQRILGRAAVEMIPGGIRECLGLDESYGLRRHEGWIVRLAGAASNRIVLPQSPAVQACVRLGLPPTHLYTFPLRRPPRAG